MMHPQTLSRQRVTRPTRSCNIRTRWSTANSTVYCVRCKGIAGELQTEVFAPYQGLALLTVGHARLPVSLIGSQHNFVASQKEPDNIHVNPDARRKSSRRRCFSSVTHVLRDTLRRHRKMCLREEINRGARMPLAPSYEMKTSKCSQQCHKKVLARKITFSGGIRLSPGPTMAAQLKGLLPRTGWRDATQAWAIEPGLSLSLLRVRLASGVVWARP